MSCTKAVIENIKKYKNSISLISTHFTQICDIENVNYLKFIAEKNKNGLYTFLTKFSLEFLIKILLLIF